MVHLINNAVPGDIVGAAGTLAAGAEYTIFLDLSNLTSGGSAQSPGDLHTTGQFSLTFELAANILFACAGADLNDDGVVDTADLGILIGQFGTAGPAADINGDGVVDTADLGLLIGAFGAVCL